MHRSGGEEDGEDESLEYVDWTMPRVMNLTVG